MDEQFRRDDLSVTEKLSRRLSPYRCIPRCQLMTWLSWWIQFSKALLLWGNNACLHINATSHTGGAARAMRRLHTTLVEKGHDSQFLVGRSIDPEDPIFNLIWDEICTLPFSSESIKSRIGNQIEKYIGIHPWANRTNLRITDTPLYQWADIIDLRNLFGGYFNLWSLPRLIRSKASCLAIARSVGNNRSLCLSL